MLMCFPLTRLNVLIQFLKEGKEQTFGKVKIRVVQHFNRARTTTSFMPGPLAAACLNGFVPILENSLDCTNSVNDPPESE